MNRAKTTDVETYSYDKPYDQCLDCPDLGRSCDGPNMLAMSLERWCEWCRKRKEDLGLTNVQIAEASRVSVPTVDRIMAGNCNKDVRRSTCADISSALISSWGKYPCARPKPVDNHEHVKKIEEQAEEIRSLKEQISSMKAEHKENMVHSEELAEKKVAYLKELVVKREQRIDEQNRRLEEQEDRLAKERGFLLKSIILSAICLVAILAALLIDFTNPDIGFFWLQ